MFKEKEFALYNNKKVLVLEANEALRGFEKRYKIQYLHDDSVYSVNESELKPYCNCGVWSLYGVKCSNTFHSDYCPIGIKK
jgi:hypothetical protein